IIIGTLLYGIKGTAWGYVLAIFCSTSLSLFIMSKLFNIKLIETIRAVALPFSITITPSFISYTLMNLGLNWFILVFIYIIMILMLIYIFAQRDLNEIRKLFTDRKHIY